MDFRVEVKPYRRKFLRPLQTCYGLWSWREGALIRFTHRTGAYGYGEVAPIPWFGTESLSEALDCLQGKTGWLSAPDLLDIPDSLPATQFAVETALNRITGVAQSEERPGTESVDASISRGDICGLLPAGEQALQVLPQRLQQGCRARKWKIGVFPLEQEIAWLKTLATYADSCCSLRLDANGGLTQTQAEIWLETCDVLNTAAKQSQFSNQDEATVQCSQKIDRPIAFLEQPLPSEQVEAMKQLCEQFQTPIALDESATTVAKLKQLLVEDWPGLVVIKPAIAGFPSQLGQIITPLKTRVIFSSAFETVIGHRAAQTFALDHYRKTSVPKKFPPLGFDTLGYFDDDWDFLTPEQLWDRI
jgi:O-succinylbenzoate synthase